MKTLSDEQIKAIADGLWERLGNYSQLEFAREILAAMLPGPYYMGPPDGGSVTVLEQIRRTLAVSVPTRSADVLCVFAPGANLRLVPVGSMPGELEAFVDTARENKQ